MNKSVITVSILLVFATMYSCKGNNKQEEQGSQSSAAPTTAETKPAENVGSEPKTFTMVAMPDTVSLGKNKEAFLKIKNLKAIELSGPDGKVTGMELSYQIELTNKNAIGGSAIGLPTTNFRLELDNGTKISSNTVFVSAEPEATKLSEVDKFLIPAGAKPNILNLFFDETRASVKLELK